ncbi:MAG: VirB3 family type IV secretion system protein [Parachlamydiales bacterium]|jgi:hypothetical protein
MFSSEYNNKKSGRLPSDFEIIEMSEDPETIAYGMYSALVSYEDHYNDLQTKYKALAITWVLATFVGIGYLVSGFEKDLHIDVLLVISFLSILSAQGVSLLWYLDAGIYESLIFSIWQEIYKLEKQYPSLGNSHHLVKKLFKGLTKPRLFHGVFYAYFVFFLLAIGATGISLYLYNINKWLLSLSIPLFFIIILILNRISSKPLCADKEDDFN